MMHRDLIPEPDPAPVISMWDEEKSHPVRMAAAYLATVAAALIASGWQPWGFAG